VRLRKEEMRIERLRASEKMRIERLRASEEMSIEELWAMKGTPYSLSTK
jgi:hypothetical protein